MFEKPSSSVHIFFYIQVNMHFIAVEGMHEEAWAILYYIVYL